MVIYILIYFLNIFIPTLAHTNSVLGIQTLWQCWPFELQKCLGSLNTEPECIKN